MKRKARRKTRVEGYAEVMIAPLLDMFVNVLLFLLYFVDPRVTESDTLQLPKSAAREEVEAGPRVRIAPEGISVEGAELVSLQKGMLPSGVGRTGHSIDPVVSSLSRVRARSTEGMASPILVVECDETIPWATLGDVLASAGAAGFEQYRFVVLRSQ